MTPPVDIQRFRKNIEDEERQSWLPDDSERRNSWPYNKTEYPRHIIEEQERNRAIIELGEGAPEEEITRLIKWNRRRWSIPNTPAWKDEWRTPHEQIHFYRGQFFKCTCKWIRIPEEEK